MLADDLVFPLVYQGKIEPGVIAKDSLLFGVLKIVPNLRSMQESLGGNTSYMKAGAAQFSVFFNDGCFKPVLASPYRGRVAPRTTADDHEVVCHVFSSS